MNSLNVLNDTLNGTKADKHEKVIVLIAACIDLGIRRGSEIISRLSDLGYDKGHIALLLKHNRQGTVDKLWIRDNDGLYSLVKD
ncbi:hypothetical protein [Parasphingorhabdus sp.]|uniref:hypothetical protein n=1 Tax=Parasphingorhabdus sp. TaxID=2709688 RepID=UPI0030019B76